MEETLRQLAATVSTLLEAMALLVIVIGAVETIVGVFRIVVTRHSSGTLRRSVWLEFSHWLVAGLTFQLAADIVSTMVAPGWDDIGRVAAIAVIRTFLTFFLDRDIETIRDRNAKGVDRAAGA